MKHAFAFVVAATLAGPAFADQALATAKNCMTCHAVDKDVLGPSFRKIAIKYASDKGAADRLAVKIVKGGGGVWGTAVMPANPQVTEAEAKKLALWALNQK
jgi:cytochrome c